MIKEGTVTKRKVVPLKGEGEYQDSKTEETWELFNRLLAEHDLSIKQFSEMVDLARSTLTEFHNRTYPFPDEVALKLRPQLEAIERRLAEKAAESASGGVSLVEDDIFETRAFKRARQVLEACRSRRELGIIVGPAGVGKTVAVKAYAESASSTSGGETFLMTANVTFGKIGCLKVLAKRFGLDPFRNSMFLLDEIAAELRSSPRFVIVDEADQLNHPGLEILRTIHDKCAGRIGMVLSGLPLLWRKMTTGQKGGADLSQLYSRVAVFASLPMPNRKEVQAFVKARYEGKVSTEVVDVLAQEAAMFGMRRLAKLLPGAIEVARRNDQELSVEAVEAARDAYMMVV